jgi:hypothetical protein
MGLRKATNQSSRKRTQRRFEAARLDYERITGPRRTILSERDATTDGIRVNMTTSNVPPNLSQITRERVKDGGLFIDSYLEDGLIEDSILEIVFKGNSAFTYMKHWRSEIGLEAQIRMGAISSAVSGAPGRYEYGYILPIADSMSVGGKYTNPTHKQTEVRYCRLTGLGYPMTNGWTYGGGLPGTAQAKGPRMTKEQNSTVRTFTPGMTVQAGEFISATIASVNDGRTYQCIQSGTVSTMTTWPVWTATPYGDLVSGDTSQPINDGTAKFICVGFPYHSDGMQWVTGGHVDIYRCYIDGAPNSALIIQSQQYGVEAMNAPTQNIVTRECTLMNPRSDTTGIYCYSSGSGANSIDPIDGKAAGGLYVDGGVWKEYPYAYLTRPWGIQWIDNTWLDQPVAPRPSNAVQMIRSTSSALTNGQLFVSSPTRWKEMVAAQFNLNTTSDAALLESMLLGRIDWTNFMSTVNINQTVLNNRKAQGISYGACDARSAHVWSGNTNQVGGLIHPTAWANFSASFDSNGYYTGI